jgi:hypothetical protein
MLDRFSKGLLALQSFNLKLCDGPRAVMCRCSDGWTGRYMTYDKTAEYRRGVGWWEYVRDRYNTEYTAPEYPHFVRLEKMDWAALVRLQMKLGVKWKFPEGDEGAIGRRMLEDPDSLPVESYGSNGYEMQVSYWGSPDWVEFNREGVFDFDESSERQWIRENLVLNGYLTRIMKKCRPDCNWPV